jgi:hypothetical protein
MSKPVAMACRMHMFYQTHADRRHPATPGRNPLTMSRPIALAPTLTYTSTPCTPSGGSPSGPTASWSVSATATCKSTFAKLASPWQTSMLHVSARPTTPRMSAQQLRQPTAQSNQPTAQSLGDCSCPLRTIESPVAFELNCYIVRNQWSATATTIHTYGEPGEKLGKIYNGVQRLISFTVFAFTIL